MRCFDFDQRYHSKGLTVLENNRVTKPTIVLPKNYPSTPAGGYALSVTGRGWADNYPNGNP